VVVGLLVALGLAIRLFAATQANDVYEGGQVVVPQSATASADKGDAGLKRIEEQIDNILQVQETILAQYEDIMESLRIAKFRVSR